jgi:Zn-dependent protease
MFILNLLLGQLSILSVLGIAAGFIIGVTVHEFAHAYIAFKNGDATAKYEGRLTLNPLAHLDPVGTIMFLVVGFGWGRPVPYNPNNLRGKNSELQIALAGIVTNIITAFIIALPIRFALMSGHLIESSSILVFLNWIVEINLIMAAFNLIPIPPLDGSSLIEAFLSEEQKIMFRQYGPTILIGLILLGFTTNISIFQMFVEPIVRVLSLLVKGTYSYLF